MVCQHYRRCLHLSQAHPARRPSKVCPFPPGGGRGHVKLCPLRRRSRGEQLGWGGRGAIGIGLLAALLVVLALSGSAHGDDALEHYRIVDGAIPEPLTAQPGDPEQGRRIVLNRDGGDCTICHAMPLPQREFHGTVGPPLDGIGRRATPGTLRLRLVDPKAFNAGTIMPAYYKVTGLHRVLDRYRARTILTAQQIEDVIAYLMTLTD